MERPHILHMFTTGPQMSPFDINMAADAGYDIIAPYTHLEPTSVTALTQDAIFSRGPKGVARTGIFIGGRDAIVAADMLDLAKRAMQPPFVVSVMADPSGAYTTAAAMVACVQQALARLHGHGLQNQRVLVLGGLGPVGRIVGVLAAHAGAQVSLSSSKGLAVAKQGALDTSTRFGAALSGVSGDSVDALKASLVNADVLMACTPAGVRVAHLADLTAALSLKVAADLNAVAPSGIESVEAMSDCVPIPGTKAVGIGALVVGDIKYRTQHQLLMQMHDAPEAVFLSFKEAHDKALSILATRAKTEALKPT